MKKLIIFALMGALASGCDESDDQEYRVLPVTALTLDGDEVPAGTYDEATNVLSFAPAFIDEIEARGQDDGSSRAIDWQTGLEVGGVVDSLEDLHEHEWSVDSELVDDEPGSSEPLSVDDFAAEDGAPLLVCSYDTCMGHCKGNNDSFERFSACHNVCRTCDEL